MNRFISATLLAMIGLMSACPGSAAAPGTAALYDVEIIIFRVSSPGTDEDWHAPVAGRGFGNNANRGGAVPTIVRILAPTDYRMNALESTLKSSGAWRPVAHAAWIQTAANWGTHTGFDLSDLGINTPGLSGTVYLERAPIYMHLGFDLQYQGAETYVIKDMRSIKYSDKQYFDHPAFGVIAMVTPIKHTEAAAERQ